MRTTTHRGRRGLFAGVTALALLLAACGDDDDSSSDETEAPAATEAPAESEAPAGTEAQGGGEVSGSITITGSSTVEPISTAIGNAFADANPDVAVTVEGPGTGDGFAKFCAGEADISDASRPINEEEVATCEENGIEFVELKVAIDGLSVITSAEDEAISCLSFVDLWGLLGPDSTGINNWADASAITDEAAATVTDLGAPNTPYPDAPLAITAPGEESGTFDAFNELVIATVGEELGVEDAVVRPDYTASPNDNVIVEGIAQNPTSLGWVGFAFVEENLDVIKPLQVDGGGGCVEPTPETIASGEYPIARDLFIYVNAAGADENPALASFVDYYVSDDGIGTVLGTDVEAGQIPYVPLAAEDLEATRSAWEARTTGTQQG